MAAGEWQRRTARAERFGQFVFGSGGPIRSRREAGIHSVTSSAKAS